MNETVTGILVAFLTATGPLAILVTKAVDTVRNLIDKGDSPDTLPKAV